MSARRSHDSRRDAVVVGGGFYGAMIAIYLARQRGMQGVLLIERESALMARASHKNQARVHSGYHYPRSYTTAYRSRTNAPRFARDWPNVVKKDFTSVYAIARNNSKVTARQFERFCREIGADLVPVDLTIRQLFEPRLIDAVFQVEEFCFDATQLRQWAAAELNDCGVEVCLDTVATEISRTDGGGLDMRLESPDGSASSQTSRYVFNCTYSGLNQFGGDFTETSTRLKHEIAEIALMQMPAVLSGLGITVLDGPFFSVLPFPARGELHTLSHVRYTPHCHWQDERGINPYERLDSYGRASRVDRMIRDSSRILPALNDSKYVDSLFEIKTVLEKNEADDGRPILFESHVDLPGCFSVLGGKIDNIYDVLNKMDTLELR